MSVKKMNCKVTLLIFLAVLVSLSYVKTLQVSSSRNHHESPSSLWLIEDESIKVLNNERLLELSNRVGPNMRASSDYHDYRDIHQNDSVAAWSSLESQILSFTQEQVNHFRPKVERLLAHANVSEICLEAVNKVFKSLYQLDSWAFEMYNSMGNFPPVGMLDGSFTDTGSYQGCVDLKTSIKVDGEQSYASYCEVPFRPIVESRPRFHMTFHQLPGLENVFPKQHLLNKLSKRAQYFNYVYLKTGVCVPQECSAIDVQMVAKLVARRLSLMSGPVKCFSRAQIEAKADEPEVNLTLIENEPVQVSIEAPLNGKQSTAIRIIMVFFSIVLFSTVWHAIELGSAGFTADVGSLNKELKDRSRESARQFTQTKCSFQYLAFQYFSAITNLKEFINPATKPNEITCLHGLRVITMVWIILVHTLQYNEWAGFTRIFENVNLLQDPLFHPYYNANYVVDNFFLMSGLLAAYTTWHANKGGQYNFSALASLVGRYMRLTPQVLLVSLLYMLLPLAADGPFWYNMTHGEARNCEKHWWINLLHLQAFYKEDEICNLVGWWISVDMVYYVCAIILIYMILKQVYFGALFSTVLLVVGCHLASAYKHYNGRYTPNNLGTVPQIGEVWTYYIVNFFWSPLPHAYPFFLGFWVGYVLANEKLKRFVKNWSLSGSILAFVCLILVNMSSHIWMSGAVDLGEQYLMTAYNNICTFVWATAFAWIIMACHYNCLPFINNVLSMKPFVLLSKASFIIYLSHMLVVRLYFGSNKFVIEVSRMTLTYIVVGNTFLSIILGVLLCITFEGPFMKIQRAIVRKIHPPPTRTTNSLALGEARKLSSSEELKKSIGASGRVLLK